MSSSPSDNLAAQSGALIDFLDKAYDAPGRPDRFQDVMEAARGVFFAPETDAPITPRLLALDEKLAPHMARIQTLLDEAGGRTGSAPAPCHAHFTLGPGGRVVGADAAAKTFIGSGAEIGALNLDHASKRKLTDCLHNAGEDTVVILTNEDLRQSAAALCRRHGEGPETRLNISLSHMDWTQEAVTFVGKAMGLTEAETQTLAGHLRGQSQSEIARARGRSAETVKAQAKAILRKSGCAKMSEVTQLGASLALLHALAPPADKSQPVNTERPLTLPLKDGRTLGYYVYGATNGFPLLFFHGSLYGPFFTAAFVGGLKKLGVTLYAPSRPGFGETSPAKDYNGATLRDALALIDRIGAQDLLLAAHMGGGPHAFRCAGALGERVKGMVMIGAGIPIDEKRHVGRMNYFTRIAAQAVKHAPAMMEIITRIAMANYKRRGYRKFYEDYFAGSPADEEAMRDPEIYAIAEKGLAHLIGQGPKTFIADGRAQMEDWTDDFDRANARAVWLNAEDDPVMGAEFVRDYVSARTNHPVELAPHGGYNLLHLHPGMTLALIEKALFW